MMARRTDVAAIGAAFVAACAQPPPQKQPPAPPTLSVPVALIQRVCEKARPDVGSGHFDGHAQLLWSKDGAVVAIDCSLTVRVDGLSTTTVRVDLRDERARGLREFLTSRTGSR